MGAVRGISLVHGRYKASFADRRETSALESRDWGQEKEWEAEITEQMPDQRIAWTCRDGPMKGGIVTFQALPNAKAEITLQIAYDPEVLLNMLETPPDSCLYVCEEIRTI